RCARASRRVPSAPRCAGSPSARRSGTTSGGPSSAPTRHRTTRCGRMSHCSASALRSSPTGSSSEPAGNTPPAPTTAQGRNDMSSTSITRRGVLLGGASLGLAALLSSCVGSGGSGGGGGGSTTGGGGGNGAVVPQSAIQDTDPKAALEALVGDCTDADATLTSVATEQFRAQLTNYLRSNDPPEVLTWYAGSVARAYASEGLLLDVSSLWEGDGACAGFSDALR